MVGKVLDMKEEGCLPRYFVGRATTVGILVWALAGGKGQAEGARLRLPAN